ncbi:amino acid ABC transporter ATP-binding protein [Sphaerisporangium krabiense]|uniref:Polar amino acid transport system ATP-binding protein n=1 Tax=Sphaerisporangium krabiense TaxID=763782 RepID=A0A7W9DPV0_9ACTN|nr:amino acid ABC transporter ATP-binding protein [Sphaerisporangium krabiense]MBB5626872.1 polar amino acid transport system ATP-binding protein [Sphaerisporangium krabiense]GII66671.1 amino acid ABC transporter ATP-binding protein [Sphaerisporangium krabiense]
MSEPTIQIRDLHKSFGGLEVLRGVDLDVQSGEVVAVLGRSGSGKSTMLRCVNLLETPTSGTITVGGTAAFAGRKAARGRDLVALRRKVGMLFQGLNVFPHLSVVENVALPMVRSLRTGHEEAVDTAIRLLGKVGLVEKALSMPGQLSGGQLQRVALARALAMNPLALLFDEPTSALDPESTMDVLNVMKDLSAEGMTMIIVTHEVKFALDVADTVLMIAEGKVIERGSPAQIAENPQEQLTRKFLAEHTKFEGSAA